MPTPTKSRSQRPCWPDLPLPQTMALLQRIASNSEIPPSRPDNDLCWAHGYRARVRDAQGAVRFSICEADSSLVSALHAEPLPFELQQLSSRGLRDFWESDLLVAMTSRKVVRGHFHITGSLPNLLVDHLIVPEVRHPSPLYLKGWFCYSRSPTPAELGSSDIHLKRYRRTRPTSKPDTTQTSKLLRRIFGGDKRSGMVP